MTLYEVVDADELPAFDPTKMVKHVMLSPANVQRVSRITRTYGRLITLSYFIGALMYPVVLFTPARVGQTLAVIEAALEIPVYVMVLLRADLVLLVTTSYDYWFFTVATIVFGLTFSLSFRDLRIVISVLRGIGFQMIILIDANAYQPRSLVFGAAFSLALTMLNIAAVALDAVPDTWRPVARSDQPHPPISNRDLLVNSLVTMGILLMRLVFHQHRLIRSARTKGKRSRTSSKLAFVQCVTIRCSIKLRTATLPNVGRRTSSCGAMAPSAQANHVQLRRVANDGMIYDSTEIILRTQLRPWQGVCIRGAGSMGFLLTTACYIVMFSTTETKLSSAVIAMCTGALLTTVTFATMSLLHCNHRLLGHVCWTFDFVFLSIQITMAHLCVMDMLQWRLVAVGTFACGWLWIHWVLIFDALLPETKQQLGLGRSRIMALVVLVTYISAQVALLIIGLFWSRWELRNRVFLRFGLLGYNLEFRVLPFFISRMMTVTLWTLRLLWRYYYQDDPNKLIMVRGQVEFEYEHRARLKASVTAASVAPVPASPGVAPSLGRPP